MLEPQIPKICIKNKNHRDLDIHRAGSGSFCDTCFRRTNGERVYRCGMLHLFTLYSPKTNFQTCTSLKPSVKCDVYICFTCCPETDEDTTCCLNRCSPVTMLNVRPVRGLVEFFQKNSNERRFLQYFSSNSPYFYYCCGGMYVQN